ncbi:MAG: hypothetical protein GX141_11295, partial [Armatimonadetes bacterium]|nr:hypothetical protein [Armatimonadota bacterium]
MMIGASGTAYATGLAAVGMYSTGDRNSYFIRNNSGYANIGQRGQPATCGVAGWVYYELEFKSDGKMYAKAQDAYVARTHNSDRTASAINNGITHVYVGLGVSTDHIGAWDDIAWTGYKPGTPTGIAASAQSTSSIKWTASAASDNNQFGFALMDGGTEKVVSPTDTRQASADLTETGLAANTNYTRSIRAWNGDHNSASSSTASRYTLQNTPATPTFANVTTSGFRVSTTGPVNITTGSSGVVFHNGVADRAKVTVLYEDITGLAANTQYIYKAKGVNAENVATGYSATASKYTLSIPPVANSITASTTAPCQGENVVWTSNLPWGANGVQYYRYVWDQNAAHTWTNTETQWTSGTLSLAPTAAGTWYLHIRGYNAENVANGEYDYSVTATANFSVGTITGGGGSACGTIDPGAMTYGGGSGGGALTYQWYSKIGTDGPDASDTLIAGATNASYDPPAGLAQTTTYNVQVTPTCGTAAFTSTPVTVSVYPLPTAPTSPTSNASCGPGSVAFGVTAASGCTVIWYDAASGGNVVSTDNPYNANLVATTTYYAAAVSVDGCESASRTAVTGTIHPLPNAPTNAQASPSTIGPGGSSTLSASVGNGEEVVWYSGSCGGTLVTSPVSPTVTTTYFAKAKNTTTGCESATCAQVTVTYVPDDEGPELEIISVTDSDTGATGNFLKGTVTVEATAADDSGVAKVEYRIDDGDLVEMTLDQDSGYYVAEFDIDADWTNGQHSVTVVATDIYNNTSDETEYFNVNKNEISGRIEIHGAVQVSDLTREVTFVLNGDVSKSRTVELVFGRNGGALGKAYYILTDVDEVTSISAKTKWHLRRKVSVTMQKGQAEVDFTGTKWLLGGDLVTPGAPFGDNVVNALDYAILRSSWGYGAAGDITGDGYTNNHD